MMIDKSDLDNNEIRIILEGLQLELVNTYLESLITQDCTCI